MKQKSLVPYFLEKNEFPFFLYLIEKQKTLDYLSNKVQEDFFPSAEGKELWKALIYLRKNLGDNLNFLAIEEYLDNNKDKLVSNIRNVWGSIRSQQLLNAEEANKYIDELEKHGAQLLTKKHIDQAEILLSLEKNEAAAEQLSQALDKVQGYLMVGEILDDANVCVDEFVKRHEESNPDADGVIGVKTGLPNLDFLTKGLKPGELTIIGAQSSVGKSALMATMINFISRTEAVAFFSLEMDRPEFFKRLISMESNLRMEEINSKSYQRNPKLTQQFADAVASYRKRRIYASKYASMTIKQIHTGIKQTVIKNPDIKVVFIDYLQYIQSHKNNSSTNTHQIISEISKGLKTIARDMNLSVVALSQLNRETSKQTKPTIHNLKESGSIEQDADIVLLLYRTNKPVITPPKNCSYLIRHINIEVAKNRNGAVGALQCEFYPEFTRFRDICLLNDGKAAKEVENLGLPEWIMELDEESVKPTKLVGNDEIETEKNTEEIPF